MTTKHTAGPWVVFGEDSCGGLDYIEISAGVMGTRTFHSLAYVQPHVGDDGYQLPFTEEDYANARLIAAAPDLLNALKSAYSVLLASNPDDTPLLSERLELARAAIAKATGGRT